MKDDAKMTIAGPTIFFDVFLSAMILAFVPGCKSAAKSSVVANLPYYIGGTNLNLSRGDERIKLFIDQANAAGLDNTIFVLEKRMEKAKYLSAKMSFDLGKLYMARREYGKARINFAQAMGLSKNRLEGARLLAEIELRIGKTKKAIYLLENMGGQSVKDENFLNTLAMAYHSDGRGKLAMTTWQAALELNPAHAESAANLTIYLLRAERPDLAIKYRNKIQGIDNLAFLLELVGILDANSKKLDTAAESYDTALQLQPSNRLIFNKSVAQFKSKRFDDALSGIDAILKRKSLSAELRARATDFRKTILNRLKKKNLASL